MAKRLTRKQERAMYARYSMLREAAKQLQKEKYESCVKKVKKKRNINPYAVCRVR